jgi:hypothetical protein
MKTLLEFIEPSEPPKPFNLRFWERMYGFEFASSELSQIKELHSAMKSREPNVKGYVKALSDDRFVLLPTLFTPQFHVLCTCPIGMKLPSENSYIEVEGKARWSEIRYTLETKVQGEKEILVDKWKNISPEWLKLTKPEIGFKGFKAAIFEQVYNVENFIQDLIAYQAISCPEFQGYLGGLNVCLYTATKENLPPKVIDELKRVVPADISKTYTLNTEFGRIGLRFKYNHATANADRRLSDEAIKILANRSSRFPFKEISMSLGSKRKTPQTLDESPCRLTDFPTVLNEETDIGRKKLDPAFEAFQYMLIQQLQDPVMPNPTDAISKVQENLLKLQASYDFSPSTLARFKILDVSYSGKPQSIVRLAMASARAESERHVTPDQIDHAIQKFNRNFDYIYELWSDRQELFRDEEERTLRERMLSRLSPDERKIYRAVEKLQSSDKACVSKEEISALLPNLTEFALETLLHDLTVGKGLLYEKSHNCYGALPIPAW